MSTADGYVQPKPGVPKTLGILSIVFASLILLFDTCQGFMSYFASSIGHVLDANLKNVQSQIDAQWKAELAESANASHEEQPA